MTMDSLAIRMVCNEFRYLAELLTRDTRLLVVAILAIFPSSLQLLATSPLLPMVTPLLHIATSIDNNGPTVLSVGPLVVVAVCLGSALLSYKTFVIAPAIEA